MSHAIQITEFGGPEVMKFVEVECGEPGPGQVKIRHQACGLNFIDVYHRSGLYPNALPLILGTEGAGIVEAVGAGVTHVRVGDRVAYGGSPPGAYSETRLMPAQLVVRLPEGITFETAAAMMLKGLTAHFLLKKTLPQGGLQAGDFVLFHAAAGGVGSIACQWARALGLQLIGTAGSEDKCARVRELGAAHVINYRTQDFVAEVKRITGGRGVKVVYDGVGKDTFERSLDSLAPFGLMVSFGNASGPPAPLSVGTLAAKGSLYLTRPTLFTHIAVPESLQAMAEDLFQVVQSGQVNIQVEQRYALADAPQAHRDLESRKTAGSSVLLP